MYFHAQNINEDRRSRRKGSMLWHGRAWWHFGRGCTLGVSWKLLSHFCHATLTVRPDAESTVGVSLAFPGVALWAHLDTPGIPVLDALKRRAGAKYGTDREIGLRVHSGSIWWSLWADVMEWRSSDPRLRHGSVNLPDLILGRARHSSEEVERRDVLIPMPEGAYKATATLELATWQRSRWPWPRRMYRVKLDVPEGIPLVASGLRDRRRYGNASNQRPTVVVEK